MAKNSTTRLLGDTPAGAFFYTHLGTLRPLLWIILAAAVIFWAWERLAFLGMDYEWQWNRAWRQLVVSTPNGLKAGPLLDGVLLTIGIAVLGMISSTLLGLVLACMRLSTCRAWQSFARIYINIFRNTPLLLQLFFVYFLIAPLFSLGPFASAILALGAFEGAYMAELFRAGLLSAPREQWEAALSLGFNLRQTFFFAILPQAFRNSLPAFTNQAVAVIKDTSLVSAIAVADLTMRAQAIIAETFLAFEIWLIVGAIYLLLALCVSLPGLWLEKRQAWR